MLARRQLTADSLLVDARLRTLLIYGALVTVAWVASDNAFSRGSTTTVILLIGMVAACLAALIFWRPVLGLYSAVLLDIVMDPTTPGDPISKYTDYFHEDLNTFAHAGIAFSPMELLITLTTIAYLVRAIVYRRSLRGGTLSAHVIAFGAFLLGGYLWGFANHGDPKIGLFELRAPFMVVLLYFLVTNLIREQEQVQRLVLMVVAGIGILTVWDIARFIIFFHGKSGGPDGAFGTVHEDAVLFGLLLVIALVRFLFTGTHRRKWLLVALAIPAAVVMLEMQRRAAFLSLYIGALAVAIALFTLRRRLFYLIVPAAVVFTLVYSAAFWNSSSKLAEPIRAWKSQDTSTALGSRDYSSNQYRINEVADVRATIQSSPLLGIGFGRQFLNVIPLVPLPFWPFQFYTPHAEVLWIWLKVGAGGFIVFCTLLCSALMRAAGLVRQLKSSPLGLACLIAALYIVMLLGYAYVDVGLANQRTEIILGAMLGVIGVVPRFAGPHPAEPSR